MALEEGIKGAPWTRAEVEATVAVYLRMLRMQEMGQVPNKAAHNRQLHNLIPARNLQAIEYKHRNISAVLNLCGVQALRGYKPLPNFQKLLVEVVTQALAADADLDKIAIQRVETPAEVPEVENFRAFLVDAPTQKHSIKEDADGWKPPLAIKRDYLEREARNRTLGVAGELLIIRYEEQRLARLGARRLANRIEHVSKSQGDGLGYDILSFDADGRERFIEVKTTAYAAETPFFVTPKELSFSSYQPEQFFLYRLFDFREAPRMFTLHGPIPVHCRLEPTTYKATLLGPTP